jgi:transcriptional regulator GlxA family with amidase domain
MAVWPGPKCASPHGVLKALKLPNFSANEKPRLDCVQAVIDRLQQRLTEPCPLNRLAAGATLSPSHFR